MRLTVTEAAELFAGSMSLPKLRPGDIVVLKAGLWRDETIVFDARGSAQSPITLHAEIPGQTIFTGTSSLKVQGEHIIVSGLNFTNGHSVAQRISIAVTNDIDGQPRSNKLDVGCDQHSTDGPLVNRESGARAAGFRRPLRRFRPIGERP